MRGHVNKKVLRAALKGLAEDASKAQNQTNDDSYDMGYHVGREDVALELLARFLGE